MKKNIVILASGGGSNAQSIINYFDGRDDVKISAIISNKADAGVHVRAHSTGVTSYTFDKTQRQSGDMVKLIIELNPDLIVLAGYLLKISTSLIDEFHDKIINIHPALLPNYGGKGMYGMNVHRAVMAANEKESGITIHYVNKNYDEGQIIIQVSCIIEPETNAELLQKQVLKLEHYHYPRVIDGLLNTDV